MNGNQKLKISMGLLGNGIAKSRMAKLQNFLGKLQGIDIDYVLIDGASLKEFNCLDEIKQRITQGYYGLNITHPFKEQVLSIVDAPLVEEHRQIGSYNTLKFIDGQILGANTDYSGFIRGYRSKFPNTPPGKVLICGAGGVGRAIAFALTSLEASQICIYDLQHSKAENLCAALQNHGANCKAISRASLEQTMLESDGLVNCTALGMYEYPGSAFPEKYIGRQRWAFDAVYTPLKTEFMLACEQHNLSCITGFDLWIYQGLDAFTLFTGVTVNDQDTVISTALSWLD